MSRSRPAGKTEKLVAPSGIVGLWGLGGAAENGVVHSALWSPGVEWALGSRRVTRRPGTAWCLGARGERRPHGPGSGWTGSWTDRHQAGAPRPWARSRVCRDRVSPPAPPQLAGVTLVTAASPPCAPPRARASMAAFHWEDNAPCCPEGLAAQAAPSHRQTQHFLPRLRTPFLPGLGAGGGSPHLPVSPPVCAKQGRSRVCTLPRLCPHCHRMTQGLPV